jgi:uncharacterized alkaline shock family protein YloU
MDGQASISAEIVGRYAADAAREVDGVRGVPRRRGVKVVSEDHDVHVELHLAVEWGASIPAIAAGVQARVREVLLLMADVEGASVDVIVDEIGPRA